MSTGLPVCLLSIMVPSVPPLPVLLSTSPSFIWPCFVCLRQEALSGDLKCRGCCSPHPFGAESGNRITVRGPGWG